MTNVEYDSIWIVTDLLTKYVNFILYKEEYTAENLVYILQKTIVAAHSIPEVIISDRGIIYTFKF